jgi:hypothetical protein
MMHGQKIIKSHILCSVTFSEKRAYYKTMWKNVVQPDRPQMAIKYGGRALHVE